MVRTHRRVRPTGRCKLCLEVRPLCMSHLLPKAMYRILRAENKRNPNPVLFGRDFVYQTSLQAQAYLLCDFGAWES